MSVPGLRVIKIYLLYMSYSDFQKTEGYSGSDIKLVSKEAAMRPVRKIFDALENQTEGITSFFLDTSCYFIDLFHFFLKQSVT